jgi:hypothetical protein
LKQYDAVLAFGDSHVAGCELGDLSDLVKYLKGTISLEDVDAQSKLLAFPQRVADHLKIPCYNYSMSGGSNSRSLRLLVKAIQEHPNSLILFGYTSTDRTEFYYPEPGLFLGRDNDNFIQVGMNWYGRINRLIKNTKMRHPVNDIFVENLLYPRNNLNEIMFIVNAICNSKVIHLPLFPEQIPTIDNVFDFEGHTNYTDWCKANGFKQLPMLHYGLEAHTGLAELIIKDLTQ